MSNLNTIFKKPTKDYVYIDKYHIIHKYGFILNILNLKLIYPKSKTNIISLCNKRIYFPNLMMKYFNNIPHSDSKNITHLDKNVFNNNIHNLMHCLYTIKKNNKNYKNYNIHFLLIFHKYDQNFNYKASFNDLKPIYKINKMDLILYLLDHTYYFDNNHYWELEIKQIEIPNLKRYHNIFNNIYYISDDKSHVINAITKNLIKINIDYHGEHYVNLAVDKYQSIKYCLDYFKNPFFKINSDISNSLNIILNTDDDILFEEALYIKEPNLVNNNNKIIDNNNIIDNDNNTNIINNDKIINIDQDIFNKLDQLDYTELINYINEIDFTIN
jgi:hypothetical protein